MRLPSGSTWEPSRSPYGIGFDGAGEAADTRLGPLLVEGVGVAHVEVGRSGLVPGVEGQVEAEPLAVGEAVVGAALVGEGLEPERRVVGQCGRQVADGEDRAELLELAGAPGGPRDGGARGRRLRLDVGQRHQSRPHRRDLLRRHPGRQLAVDGLGPLPDRGHDLVSTLGQPQGDAAPVRRVGVAVQEAPIHQDVDDLAHRLLTHPQGGRQLLSGVRVPLCAEQDEGAVPGQVVDADRLQMGPDGPGVAAAGGAHQGRGGQVRSIGGHEGHHKRKNLDSQRSC